MEAAGWACALGAGFAGEWIMTGRDPTQVLAAYAVVRKAAEARRELDDALVGRVFGGQSGSVT